MRNYKIASILMILHGAFMELLGALSVIPLIISKNNQIDLTEYFAFKLPYLQQNLNLVVLTGGIYGIVRITGAIGLLKNRLWGLVLSVINCIVTISLMMFLLPFGIIDGLLACTSLLLILTQYFGKKENHTKIH